jgi:hypothetical protein
MDFKDGFLGPSESMDASASVCISEIPFGALQNYSLMLTSFAYVN